MYTHSISEPLYINTDRSEGRNWQWYDNSRDFNIAFTIMVEHLEYQEGNNWFEKRNMPNWPT